MPVRHVRSTVLSTLCAFAALAVAIVLMMTLTSFSGGALLSGMLTGTCLGAIIRASAVARAERERGIEVVASGWYRARYYAIPARR